ncbi:MAG: tRNA (adenosine(37)-N6)-dimethylallyltransferase MiaA [Actinobacteria bacterium]|nr:MAG: tRNA (adenosine(37)-N6)-dimethylallyltransferase MiaA [Actinomycetota bacterium]
MRVLAVVGPTAVGKSALAEQLALRCGGEVISADSMQVYRGMDVGTAKTPQGERLVTHHCIDIAEPGEPFSAALYQTQARASIGDVSSRGLLPVVCGGTGLYVRAALDDLRFPSGEQAENPVRAKYEQLAQTQGAGALHALLATREPQSAALIHPNNVRRVVRALEMLDADGVSYAAQHAGLAIRASVYDTRFVGLTMDRAALYERIDARVDRMMDEGLLGEVERLLDAGLRSALTSAQAIGYKELVQTLDGTTSLEVAVAAIKQASRRYAKRQLTWFRADKRIRWVDVTGLSPAEQVEAALHEIDW